MGTENETSTVPKNRPQEADSPSKGELFEALSNRRRRETLRYLLQQEDDATTKGEVARYIAACETGKRVEDVSSAERKRVYIALHQTHLPKLDEVGLVDYDASQGDLELTDATDGLEVYLDIETDIDVGSWGPYYVVLGVVGLVLTAIAAAGVVPVSTGYALGLSAAFTTGVTIIGIVQTYEESGEETLGDWLGRGHVDD